MRPAGGRVDHRCHASRGERRTTRWKVKVRALNKLRLRARVLDHNQWGLRAGDDVLGKQPEPLANVMTTPSISARGIGAAQPDELRHQRLDMTGGEGDGGPASDRRRGPVAAGRQTTRGLPRPLPWAGGCGLADAAGPASTAAVGRRRRAGGRRGACLDRCHGPAAAGRRTTRGLPRPLPWAGGCGPADDAEPASTAAVGRRRQAGGRRGARLDRRREPVAAGQRTTRGPLR